MSGGVVIVGGGLAGFTTAQELRRGGFDGAVTIVDPLGLPYDRPPLSKDYLSGAASAESLAFASEQWYVDHGVRLVADTVEVVDAGSGRVRRAGGGEVEADDVVLAMGGRPRRLPVPGGSAEGLLSLRTREDADALRAVLAPGAHLAIIGGGLIGAEVASAARHAGAEVTLIDPIEIPAVPALGQTIALHLHQMHARHGVSVIAEPTTAIGRVAARWRLTLDEGSRRGGTEVVADAVLVAIGIVPDVALAADAGLDVDNGILVDEGQRTSRPHVYAVGDAARLRLRDGRLAHRHEHWESAMHSGQRAAAVLLGQEPPKQAAPWMWTDRYGLHVEAVGSLTEGIPVVRERDGDPWVVFRLDDHGHLLGAAAIDGGPAIRAVRRMIERGTVVDPAQLADPGVDLKKLAC